MVNVVADPDKLRHLAAKLKSVGQQVEQLQRLARGALQSSGWNDKERERFEADLARDLRAAAAIAQRLQHDYPRTLERKARALDEFNR